MNNLIKTLMAGGATFLLLAMSQGVFAQPSRCMAQKSAADTAKSRYDMCMNSPRDFGYNCEDYKKSWVDKNRAVVKCMQGGTSGDRMHRNAGGVPEGGRFGQWW